MEQFDTMCRYMLPRAPDTSTAKVTLLSAIAVPFGLVFLAGATSAIDNLSKDGKPLEDRTIECQSLYPAARNQGLAFTVNGTKYVATLYDHQNYRV